jgi:uncharacterized protein YkvS
MAGTDLRISVLPDRPAASITGAEEVASQFGGTNNFKISLTNIKAWLIDQLTTTFVTLTGNQTLRDKNLIDPLINGVAVTVTGTVINYLSGLTANVKSLIDNLLSADIAIQERLTTLESSITPKTYSVISAFPSGWIKTIAASTIEPSLNIDWKSVIVQLYQKVSFNQSYIMQDVSSCVTINYSGDNLSSIVFDISARSVPDVATQFLFVISYKTIAEV